MEKIKNSSHSIINFETLEQLKTLKISYLENHRGSNSNQRKNFSYQFHNLFNTQLLTPLWIFKPYLKENNFKYYSARIIIKDNYIIVKINQIDFNFYIDWENHSVSKIYINHPKDITYAIFYEENKIVKLKRKKPIQHYEITPQGTPENIVYFPDFKNVKRKEMFFSQFIVKTTQHFSFEQKLIQTELLFNDGDIILIDNNSIELKKDTGMLNPPKKEITRFIEEQRELIHDIESFISLIELNFSGGNVSITPF